MPIEGVLILFRRLSFANEPILEYLMSFFSWLINSNKSEFILTDEFEIQKSVNYGLKQFFCKDCFHKSTL